MSWSSQDSHIYGNKELTRSWVIQRKPSVIKWRNVKNRSFPGGGKRGFGHCTIYLALLREKSKAELLSSLEITWFLACICAATRMKFKPPPRCTLKLLFLFKMLKLPLPIIETSFQICCSSSSPHSHCLWKDILPSKWKKKVNHCRMGALVSRMGMCLRDYKKKKEIKIAGPSKKALKMWKITISSWFQEFYCTNQHLVL